MQWLKDFVEWCRQWWLRELTIGDTSESVTKSSVRLDGTFPNCKGQFLVRWYDGHYRLVDIRKVPDPEHWEYRIEGDSGWSWLTESLIKRIHWKDLIL